MKTFLENPEKVHFDFDPILNPFWPKSRPRHFFLKIRLRHFSSIIFLRLHVKYLRKLRTKIFGRFLFETAFFMTMKKC